MYVQLIIGPILKKVINTVRRVKKKKRGKYRKKIKWNSQKIKTPGFLTRRKKLHLGNEKKVDN